MSTRMQTVLQLAVTTVAVFCAQAAKGPTCDFEPNNEAPETLTCTFQIDLRQSKHGFSVQRYSFENGHHPVSVLSCHWGEDPGPTCTVTKEYAFNASTVVSNQIVLGFQYLTQNIEGNYSCQLVPPSNGIEDSETCTYKHPDAAKGPTCAFEPHNEAPETLTCTFHIDLRQSKHGFSVQRYSFENGHHPVPVLSCHWGDDPGPTCTVTKEYVFNASTVVFNQVVLGFQNLSKNIEGNYKCQLIPPDPNGAEDSETCTYKHPDGNNHTESDEGALGLGTGSIVGIIIGVIAVIIVIIVLVIYLKKRCGVPNADQGSVRSPAVTFKAIPGNGLPD